MRKRTAIALGFAGLFAALSAAAQVPSFTEKSAELGIAAISDHAQFYGNGAAAADYDQDGDIDFYLTTDNAVRDRLYQNQGDGTFVDVAEAVGVNVNKGTRTALWFDYDGDRRLDLLVLGERCMNFSCGSPVLVWLFQQQPDGTFIDRTEGSGLIFGSKHDNIDVFAIGGVSAGDLNNDGWLDLVVCIWGGELTVFHNDGDGSFSDATQAVGLDNGRRYYWQPLLHDFNGDGTLDIFCNVDFAPNEFWLSQANGAYAEVAMQIGAGVYFNEMGAALGDFDNDGDFDIYATNITRRYAGVNQHNVLLKNESRGESVWFSEVAEQFDVHASGWDWGATFIDLNNDGWLDLATTNGWNDPSWQADDSRFWQNINGSFTDISDECRFNDSYSATTLLAFDYDRDGDQDLLQTLKENEGTEQPVVFHENGLQRAASSRYLVVKPRMGGRNRFAVGAKVKAEAEAYRNVRLITAGTSFYGQEPYEAFFGVRHHEYVDVTVEWPDGKVSVFPQVETNQTLALEYAVVETPGNLRAERIGQSVRLVWEDRSDNETGFEVQRSEQDDFSVYESFAVAANQTEFEDENIAPGKYYRYRLKAFNEAAHSPYVVARALVTTGSESQEIASGLTLYPNPSDGAFQLRLRNGYDGPVDLRLYDMTGREVWRQRLRKSGMELSADYSLELPRQTYVLQVVIGESVSYRRLIVR